MKHPNPRRAFSLMGLLISMACIVVLFAILMSSLNRAVTGEGSAQVNTVRSMQDQLNLSGLVQGMITYANDHRGRYLVPSELTGTEDPALDTTANFYSAMIAQRYFVPGQLISGNEYSGYVEEAYDYDFTAYAPREGRYWDDRFEADLHELSHVSFAHMPMFGERRQRHWKATFQGTFPILGNRGPAGGEEDPTSMTYGRNGRWGGHLAFGDGHVDFVETFTPPQVVFERDGQRHGDNIFAIDDGPAGGDAILAFTKRMTRDGPELQFD